MKTQSRNPFAPNYADPWWFKVADLIPNWLALALFIVEGALFMLWVLSGIKSFFAC